MTNSLGTVMAHTSSKTPNLVWSSLRSRYGHQWGQISHVEEETLLSSEGNERQAAVVDRERRAARKLSALDKCRSRR